MKDNGLLVGLISRQDVSAIPRERWDNETVGDAMRPWQNLPIVTPDTKDLDVLKESAGKEGDPIPVVENRRLKGIVFRSQLMHALQHQSEKKVAPTHERLLYGTGKIVEGQV